MFISLPTGFGKSIIYSLLPLCLKKLCPSVNTFILIISPLIYLMEDRMSSLKCKGIGAVLLHKDLDSAVLLYKDLDSAAMVENSHVFCSPASLLSSGMTVNFLDYKNMRILHQGSTV